MLRKLTAAGIVLGVIGFTVFLAAPADAAPASAVATVQAASGTPDFTPSSSGVKKYMLNVLGKVLGKAMPSSWQAEQVANEYQYNHSWEQLGVAVNGTPQWNVAQPQSYDDYALLAAQQQFSASQQQQFTNLTGTTAAAGKGGTAGTAFSIPAVKASKLSKVIGGAGAAATAIAGYSFGVSLGHGIDSLLGIDADGVVCSSGAAGFLSVITGSDCSAVDNTIPVADQNADVQGLGAFGDCETVSPQFVTTPTAAQIAAAQPVCAATETGYLQNGAWNVVSGQNIAAVTGTMAGGYTVKTAFFTGQTIPDSANSSSVRQGALYAWCVVNGSVTQLTVSEGGGLGWGNDQPRVFTVSKCTGTAELMAIAGHNALTGANYSAVVFTNTGGLHQGVTDPDRVLTCAITGSDGNTYTAQSDTFKETDSTLPPPECPTLPDGVTATHQKITEDGGNGSQTLADQDTTDEYQKQSSDFPGCDQGACELLLQQKQPDGTYKDCTDLGTGCEPWFTDANKADDYECTYGGTVVELDECNVYSGIFDPARVAAGAPYSDPITGQWSGGQNGPDESQQAYSTQVQDPTAPRTCDNTSASGFDPIAWVMKPVQCAMEWAWVPDPEQVHVDMTSASQAWSNTLPAEAITMVSNWSPTASNTGCKIPVSFTLPPILGGSTVDFNAVDACDGPMADVATISRLATSAAIIVLAAFAVRRAFSRSVGYGADGND